MPQPLAYQVFTQWLEVLESGVLNFCCILESPGEPKGTMSRPQLTPTKSVGPRARDPGNSIFLDSQCAATCDNQCFREVFLHLNGHTKYVAIVLIIKRKADLGGLEEAPGYCISNKSSEVTQSCPNLCNPMDCSLPGTSVHGIFQARVWSGLPFPSPGDLPDPGISSIADRHFTIWATGEAQSKAKSAVPEPYLE